MKQQTLLARGYLSWFPNERISDRYGSVHFGNASDTERFCENQRGRLTALILDTQTSQHCGDLSRSIFPSAPTIGEEIPLGEGTLFYIDQHGIQAVGVIPDDRRETDWMNPHNLYRCIDQKVELRFEPL